MNRQANLYYWRGRGPIGALVRHSSASPWDHVAISVEAFGLDSYFESYPGAGFRLVPVAGDIPPEGIQRLGVEWTDEAIAQVMMAMSRRRYSFLNGFLTAFGVNRKSQEIQCVQACMECLGILGIKVPDNLNPEPGNLAIAIERITGNPVRLTL